MNVLKALDGEDLLWATLSFGCSDPLTAKALLQRRSEPRLRSLSLSLSLVRLSAERLVCREWLRQWEEERKKGGCGVTSATVSPQAFWSGRAHPTSLSIPLTPPTSPPLSSGTGAREGHAAKHTMGRLILAQCWGSLANTADTGELLGWFLSAIECAAPLGIHILIFRLNEQWLSSLFVQECRKGLQIIQMYSSVEVSCQTEITAALFFVFAVVWRCQSHCFILPQWHTDTHMHARTYLTPLLRDSQGVLLTLVSVCVCPPPIF